MGTSGYYGFLLKGKFYLVYNHYDSQPKCLGRNILGELQDLLDDGSAAAILHLQTLVSELKIVSRDMTPTQEDQKKLEKYTDLTVSRQSLDDWYCLLRKAQGSLKATLECGYTFRSVESPTSDYNYVVNLDNLTFDVYKSKKCKCSLSFATVLSLGQNELVSLVVTNLKTKTLVPPKVVSNYLLRSKGKIGWDKDQGSNKTNLQNL